MVRASKPHHLEGEDLIVEVVRCAKPDKQIDLPERLDVLA
jgi:hypothetical protein